MGDTVVDFLTAKPVPNVGAEANRQALIRYLVDHKGWQKADICRDLPIWVQVAGEQYHSCIDVAVRVDPHWVMAVKCAAGSLGSRQREVLAAARLAFDYQIPLSAVSDGQTAFVMQTVGGVQIGAGLDALPSKAAVMGDIRQQRIAFVPYPEDRRPREALIFRSYDSMNVNIIR